MMGGAVFQHAAKAEAEAEAEAPAGAGRDSTRLSVNTTFLPCFTPDRP